MPRSHRPAASRSLAALLLALVGTSATACPPHERSPDPETSPLPRCRREPLIQLAILLDTSGSMEGLIHQARSRIWDVVNDLNKASRDGRRARLEVALYQYGSDRLPSCEGFLTLVQSFTSDLDLLSERLFALEVDGQAEYCGWAIDSALTHLSWDATPISTPMVEQPLRVLVIAGNEPFTQGPKSYRAAIEPACCRGIIINTIYCGSADEGASTGWQDGARLGRGAYLSIDHHRVVPVMRCPQDDDLARLNNELNATYIPFGARGGEYKTRQETQDALNVAASPSGAASRYAAKATSAYNNAQWDLVDAVRERSADLDEISTEALPEGMRGMTIQQRKDQVQQMAAQRDRIQADIRRLSAERDRHLNDHRPRGDRDTLDSAIIRALREQARRLGFRFEPD